MAIPEPAYKIGAFLIEHVRAWGWAIVGWFSRDAQRNRQIARLLDWLGRIRRVDEATNQSAVRRSHTAGRRLRAGRYGLPQWRSRGQPLGSDAAVGGGPAASREDEYRRGARGVELLDRVAPKAIAEQKARRVACETVHVSVVTSHYVVPDGGWAAPARAESLGTYRRSTLSRLRRRRVRCRLHPSSRAGASPASSLRHL